jgi:hypothetical protein
MTEDEQDVWNRMQAVYAGFLAGEPAAVDALLHPEVTLWDSAQFGLVRGLGELAELRKRRPSGAGPGVVRLEANEPVIDVWGDTALVRHLLVVELADGSTETVRNTSVWRRTDGQWLAVHNHEDVAGGGAQP